MYNSGKYYAVHIYNAFFLSKGNLRINFNIFFSTFTSVASLECTLEYWYLNIALRAHIPWNGQKATRIEAWETDHVRWNWIFMTFWANSIVQQTTYFLYQILLSSTYKKLIHAICLNLKLNFRASFVKSTPKKLRLVLLNSKNIDLK